MKLLPVWIFGILILCTSCADDNELAWVSVRNDTDYNLEIEFLPTENANGYKLQASLDPEIVFLAWFVPSYSSQAFPERVIVNPNTNSNKFRFNLGYPVPDYEREDPCNDPRIVARLEADNKLITLGK